MYVLLSLVVLAVAGATHVAAVVAARRVVDRAAGNPIGPRSLGFALGRGAAGVAGWYLAGTFLFLVGFLARGETLVDETSMRVHVAAAGPAARAGVKSGDRIIKLAGEPITSWPQLKTVVASHPGEAIAIDGERAGQAVTLTATPEGSPAKIMVGPWTEERSMSLGQALGSALMAPANVVATSLKGLMRTFQRREPVDAVGPVGIVHETSKVAKVGLGNAVLLTAALTSYVLPYVLIASALYEILARRRANRERFE